MKTIVVLFTFILCIISYKNYAQNTDCAVYECVLKYLNKMYNKNDNVYEVIDGDPCNPKERKIKLNYNTYYYFHIQGSKMKFNFEIYKNLFMSFVDLKVNQNEFIDSNNTINPTDCIFSNSIKWKLINKDVAARGILDDNIFDEKNNIQYNSARMIFSKIIYFKNDIAFLYLFLNEGRIPGMSNFYGFYLKRNNSVWKVKKIKFEIR